MFAHHVALGKAGEDLACRELTRRGYAILDRRWRQRFGEIDIVARQGRVVVFVEVKAREGSRCGAAVEAISAAKRRQLIRLARMYVARRHLIESPCRFDVVAVDTDAGRTVVQIFPNAFDAGTS